MMSKKVIYLLVALILPGSIFVFLKIFGRNEFSIPVYYQNGVAEVKGACTYEYESPFRVPDSIMIRIRKTEKTGAVLVIADQTASVKAGLTQLMEQVDERDYEIVVATAPELPWDEWFTCILFLKKPWSAVLIDADNQIRGYYNPETREELDRLAVELKILLKQY